MIFRDRNDAGEKLASILAGEDLKVDYILGLLRGGLAVAKVVADFLKVPFSVIVVRKLGLPNFPELGFGAIAPNDVLVVDQSLTDRLGLDHAQIQAVIGKEKNELLRRLKAYDLPVDLINLEDKTVAIIDDGIATGTTMLAAIKYVKKYNPKQIIVAVPVSPIGIKEIIEKEADKFITLSEESFFAAVGQFYFKFEQVKDDEVRELLRKN